jgi:deoxycytidylate deaminase
MSEPARRLPVVPRASDEIGEELRGSTSHDLVFAVVGHIGAGASMVGHGLVEWLKENGYATELVKVSGLILDAARLVDPSKWSALSSMQGLSRTQLLQEAGGWLRAKFSPSFTAGLAIKALHEIRKKTPEHQPSAFVIDSLKNPDEVDALRKVYGRSFYLVSVVCGTEVREKRLRTKYKGASHGQLEELMKRDEAEEVLTGQQVRKTIHAADFFVNSETSSQGVKDPTAQSLERFLQIVCGREIVRPTRDERGMHAAWSASLRSSCLSRQVGAAILDIRGELISTGTNDVPKSGGGLYEETDEAGADYRCFAYAKKDEGEERGFCRSDKSKNQLLEEVVAQLKKDGIIPDSAESATLHKSLRRTALADLIEFSRAVHAEMDAIVALARTGTAGALDGTLYCTTFPCHACARHIVAAGLREVVYYEPYIKSRALLLHDDSIEHGCSARGEDKGPVRFRLFSGVAPRRFASLFEKRSDLKQDGRVRPRSEQAQHVDPIFTRSYLSFEEVIASKVVAQMKADK